LNTENLISPLEIPLNLCNIWSLLKRAEPEDPGRNTGAIQK